jgi:hypothetical protein
MRMHWQPGIFQSPWVQNLVRLHRFEAIKSNLALIDYSDERKNKAKLKKRPFLRVEELLKTLNQTWKAVYRPQKELSFYEATCAFKGRHMWKTYSKDKPHPWGFKFYSLNEALTGFTIDTVPYEGVDTVQSNQIQLGTTHAVVAQSLERSNCFDKNHSLFMDNFYTSIPMFVHFFRRSIR